MRLKNLQRQKQSRIIRLFILISAIITCFILFTFFQHSGKWDGRSRHTIVLINQKNQDGGLPAYESAILSLEPRSGSSIFIPIPDNLVLDVPFGYKSYIASSVFGLGELDKKRGGGYLLSKSLESTLGVSINGYILLSENISLISLDNTELVKFNKRFFSVANYFSNIFKFTAKGRGIVKSDMRLADLWKLGKQVSGIRTAKIVIMNLNSNLLLSDESLPDGSKVYNLDKDTFDLRTENYFYDTYIRSDSITLKITNSADVEKAAAQFGRIVEHLGGRVLIKATGKDKQVQGCVINLKSINLEKTALVNYLKNSYNCELKLLVSADSGEIQKLGEVDLEVNLGENYIR